MTNPPTVTEEPMIAPAINDRELELFYQELVVPDSGTYVIGVHNLVIERPANDQLATPIDPVDKLWTMNLRQRIHTQFGIDIHCAVAYDDSRRTIICAFTPEYGYLSRSACQRQFFDLAPKWSYVFKQRLEEWLLAEDGYLAYQKLLDPKTFPVFPVKRYRQGFRNFFTAHYGGFHATGSGTTAGQSRPPTPHPSLIERLFSGMDPAIWPIGDAT